MLQQYLDRPQLLPHLSTVWETFWRLSRRRPMGFGVGAIPMSEFESYCRTFGVDGTEEREWLFVRLDALDSEYMDYARKQAESKKG